MTTAESRTMRLPSTWAEATFYDLNEFSGRAINPSLTPDDRFELYSVPAFPSKKAEAKLGRDIGSAKQVVTPNDVLVCKINPRINRVWLVPHAAGSTQIASSEWIGFRSQVLIPGFARYYFSSPRFRELLVSEVAGVGGSLTRAQPKKVAKYPLPVAPLNEQKRITDCLDAIVGRVSSCIDRLDLAQAMITSFRNTVLDSAVNGKLTRDWRERNERADVDQPLFDWTEDQQLPSIPPGWSWVPFAEFVLSIRSGTSVVPTSEETPFRVLRSSAVRKMGLDFDDVRYLDSIDKVKAEDQVRNGDLLFTRLSGSLEYVANCALVQDLGNESLYYPDRLFRARLRRPSLGRYIELCFASPQLRQHLIIDSKSTAGHQRISIGAITGFQIPFPPADEIAEIVHRLDSLLGFADRITARQLSASELASRLVPLALTKAFIGELVPQDPADEPAADLLASVTPRSVSPEASPRQRQKVRAPRAPKESAAMTKTRQDIDVLWKPYLSSHLQLSGPCTANNLFKDAKLPIADFYKQLAWEVAQGHIRNDKDLLEATDAS